MATNLKGAIDVWNVGTNRWLRIVVYDRVKKYPMILTYALSAVWHGFYPGYYLTFANGALFTLAARTVILFAWVIFVFVTLKILDEATCSWILPRQHWNETNIWLTDIYNYTFCYDLYYLFFRTFGILVKHKSIHVSMKKNMTMWLKKLLFSHMYLCLHLLALAALAVPYFVPKSDTESASNLAASGANIANVLRQASPLTNSVSSRNDWFSYVFM